MRDIEIKDAVYFPQPQAIYKEVPITKVLPIKGAGKYMRAWTYNGLLIIASVGEFDDGKEWLHVSLGRKSRIPSYDDLTRVKRDFIGDDRKAIMVLPEKENHVNLAENCLHLFYSKDNPLPEFSANGLI